ncbi:hypothetical protein O181_014781 [Austropuccinia psidii MF-1]|uniref:Uncharacterized protein n=1 Tax=Austropuccinia psidii MF-1 TaxID=1389203 RepID=A0A9Q3BYR6_9BASI|nr:hypothetical protein [Austropuccinia psidii MF-1]
MEYGQHNVPYGSIMSQNRNYNPEDLPQENCFNVSHVRNEMLQPTKGFKLLEERETRIREKQAAIQAIESSWHMEEPSQIQVPQYSEEGFPSSPQQSRSFLKS